MIKFCKTRQVGFSNHTALLSSVSMMTALHLQPHLMWHANNEVTDVNYAGPSGLKDLFARSTTPGEITLNNHFRNALKRAYSAEIKLEPGATGVRAFLQLHHEDGDTIFSVVMEAIEQGWTNPQTLIPLPQLVAVA